MDKPGFRRELSAGGIIYRRRQDRVEFFLIKDPFGRWTFPKGHQEEGETLEQTAVREIEEEAGLSGLRCCANLGSTHFKFKRGRTLIEKTVYLFLFEAPADVKEKLSGEEGITKAGWFGPSRARRISGYRNLDKILNHALYLALGRRFKRQRKWRPRHKKPAPTAPVAPAPRSNDTP